MIIRKFQKHAQHQKRGADSGQLHADAEGLHRSQTTNRFRSSKGGFFFKIRFPPYTRYLLKYELVNKRRSKLLVDFQISEVSVKGRSKSMHEVNRNEQRPSQS